MSEKLLVPKIRFKEFTNAWEQWKLHELVSYRSSTMVINDVKKLECLMYMIQIKQWGKPTKDQ